MWKRIIISVIIILLGLKTLGVFYLVKNNPGDKISSQSRNNVQSESERGQDDIKQPLKDRIIGPEQDIGSNIILNETGDTIEKRYNPPQGFERVVEDEDSFGVFLRNQKLKRYGEEVLFYDGRKKDSTGIYDSVIDVEIGDRDLHQCADAIMLLRAEYLYKQKKYEEISFNFTNGFRADYKMWLEGNRINVDGNNVNWSRHTRFDDSYETFRKYMDMIFAYAGTMSLENQLISVNFEEMKIGDVFIEGGSPGHAVIVVDMAQNELTGEKLFMLAQSYMPAQQTQILINPNNGEISPWYSLDFKETLITPQWNFEITELKRFQ